MELHAARAQIAFYRADWDAVSRSSDASVELAEREGLVGKLCLPYALRGWLAWREGNWDEAEESFRRAHELAEQVGWSEVSFSALYGLARTLRDHGDYAAAVTALERALDVCERAGLIAQSIQATSARGVALVIAGKVEQGREAAEEAGQLSERVHYPVGEAAALEATGRDRRGSAAGQGMMAEARELWQGLGRPLDVAICDLLLAHRAEGVGPPDGAGGARSGGGAVRRPRRRAPGATRARLRRSRATG